MVLSDPGSIPSGCVIERDRVMVARVLVSAAFCCEIQVSI